MKSEISVVGGTRSFQVLGVGSSPTSRSIDYMYKNLTQEQRAEIEKDFNELGVKIEFPDEIECESEKISG